MNKELQAASKTVVEQCMNVKKGENVLIVIDTPQQEIGRYLLQAALNAGAEAIIIEMTPRENHGQEPPAAVAAAMLAADVILVPATTSLTHTKASNEAVKKGARVATMPMITTEIMARTLNADYSEMAERCAKYAAAVENASKIHITSEAGTDLHLSLEGRQIKQDVGILHDAGVKGNLPAGEIFSAPLEGTSEGVLVIDGSMAGLGILEEPLRMEVKKGYVEKITGKSAEKLKSMLDRYGKEAYNIAELGVGMNPKAIVTGHVLEDEKVMGTVHFAVGNSVSCGGTVDVPIHLDGIVLKPTVVVDGKTILLNGQMKL